MALHSKEKATKWVLFLWKGQIGYIVKILLKLLFAAAILFWLIHQGKLDFSLIGKAFQDPKWPMLTIFLVLTTNLFGAWRWKKLVEIKAGRNLPFVPILKLSWIGLFFSSVLPGAVTGDILKIFYAKHLDPKLTKTFLIMSVLMDRIIGLIGLLFLLGGFSLYSYREVTAISPSLAHLIHFNFLLFIGVFIFFLSIFLPKTIQAKILPWTLRVPFLGERIHKTLEQVWLMGQSHGTILLCLGMSLCSQFFNILGFWSITAPFYQVPISFPHIFTFMPVGMMAVAVPISPAGLGVGHAIFDGLFKLYGTFNGASLFNLYFIITVSINLMGVFPYLMFKAHPPVEEGEPDKSLV